MLDQGNLIPRFADDRVERRRSGNTGKKVTKTTCDRGSDRLKRSMNTPRSTEKGD